MGEGEVTCICDEMSVKALGAKQRSKGVDVVLFIANRVTLCV
jgi:hypothetical protein